MKFSSDAEYKTYDVVVALPAFVRHEIKRTLCFYRDLLDVALSTPSFQDKTLSLMKDQYIKMHEIVHLSERLDDTIQRREFFVDE